jgi:hypothetical protein
VSVEAFAFSFFDLDRELHGTARSGATLLFHGRSPAVHADGPTVVESGDGWRAELADRLALELEPTSPPAELDGVTARTCRVKGTVDGTTVDCLGTFSITDVAPRWEELQAVRAISALVDDGTGLLAVARRPRTAPGHGDEEVRAVLFTEGQPHEVEEARISTVYDSGGRQRSAGLELWLPNEDFPRRGSGLVIAGSSFDLEAIEVHAAVFRWRLDGREGIGGYELMVRVEPPVAA